LGGTSYVLFCPHICTKEEETRKRKKKKKKKKKKEKKEDDDETIKKENNNHEGERFKYALPCILSDLKLKNIAIGKNSMGLEVLQTSRNSFFKKKL